MSDPLVTIIIPCYRQGRYLAASVNSALAQRDVSVEVIVVNDGSEDDTEAVARGFGDRIRYYRQKNSGPSAARNLGISHAKGKYLMFLDSDDLLHPDALKWLTKAAAGREDVMCAMGYRLFEREDEDFEESRAYFPPWSGAPEQSILLYNFGPPLCFLCPRKLLIAAGSFDASLISCEDWETWLRLVFAGAKIIPVFRLGAFYRLHPASASKNQLRMAQTRAETLRRTLGLLLADQKGVVPLTNTRAFMARELRRLRSESLQEAAFDLREQGKFWESFQHYFQSGWCWKFEMPIVLGIGKLIPKKIAWMLRKRPAATVRPAQWQEKQGGAIGDALECSTRR